MSTRNCLYCLVPLCYKIKSYSPCWYFVERQDSYKHNKSAIFTGTLLFQQSAIFFTFFLLFLNVFFWVITKVCLNCKRHPWARQLSSAIQSGWSPKASCSHCYSWRDPHQNADHGWREPFVLVCFCLLLSETLEFKYSLFKQFFAGKHSSSTLLGRLAHHLIPTRCWKLNC